jgi:hypothetical protein
MTEQRPDTDERDDPGGTPSPGQDSLMAKPATAGSGEETTRPTAAPGVYEADEDDQRRGRAVKPGN